MDNDAAKRRAARAAADLLPVEGVIGLGSGSTATMFIEEVGALVAKGRKLRGVPTSEASRARAEQLGIELLEDEGPWVIDVCVDGADEVSAELDLIKGGGGAHAREKIVNHSSRKNVIVVDESKVSTRLGEKWAVPVEVLSFGRASTAKALESFGRVVLRQREGEPWMTDSGHFIYDVETGPIDSAAELDAKLHRVPGVVETGLFVGRANLVLVAGPSGVRELRP